MDSSGRLEINAGQTTPWITSSTAEAEATVVFHFNLSFSDDGLLSVSLSEAGTHRPQEAVEGFKESFGICEAFSF